MADYAMITPTI